MKRRGVTLGVTPASGSVFHGWNGAACAGTASTCTPTMSAARSDRLADRWLGLAYDSRRDLYLANGVAGLSAYNPQTRAWAPVSNQSFVYQSNLIGFTYDAKCDVLLARTIGRHSVISAYPPSPLTISN